MCFFPNNKGKIFYVFKEKTYQMKVFIVGHCIIFSDLFCLIFFYESQTWGSMANEKLHIIYVVYIDSIQSYSSNNWMKINFYLKWNLNSKMLLCTF
jgi:hypothetical protein